MWVFCLLFLNTLWGCVTTKQQGDAMRSDIEALRAEQNVLRKALNDREANMAEMITRARKEILALESLIKKAQDALSKNDAAAGLDIQKTREEIARLLNEIDEMKLRVGKVEEEFKITREDLDFKFANLQNKQPALPTNATELLKFAKSKLAESDHQKAREAYHAFINLHPADVRVDEAIFGVGESYHTQSKFRTAIFEFQKILKHHPKSKLSADATLRIAQGLKSLNMCSKAKIFLEHVLQDYKRSPRVADARKELKLISKMKGCK